MTEHALAADQHAVERGDKIRPIIPVASLLGTEQARSVAQFSAIAMLRHRRRRRVERGS